MTQVTVLMSTYNGELYIREQLDSILTQANVTIKLLIRDDGSKDNTPLILEEYKNKYPNIIYVIKGKNIGYAASFSELVRCALSTDYPIVSEWFAFADQDDVWNNDKINHALQYINKNIPSTTPILYCSNTELVDENLNHIGYAWKKNNVSISKENCLIESFATGCTMVFNRMLAELFISHYKSSYPAAHDYFIYQLALFCGCCFWDPTSFIKYRQHGNNCIGMTTPIGKLKRKFSGKAKRKKNFLESQAQSFLELAHDVIGEDDQEIITNFINYRKNFLSKLKLIFNNRFRYSSPDMNVMFWIRILRGIL